MQIDTFIIYLTDLAVIIHAYTSIILCFYALNLFCVKIYTSKYISIMNWHDYVEYMFMCSHCHIIKKFNVDNCCLKQIYQPFDRNVKNQCGCKASMPLQSFALSFDKDVASPL